MGTCKICLGGPGTKQDFICTEIDFDFERRKWTDGNFFENDQFIEHWKERFGQVWANGITLWPKRPYQPEYLVLGTSLEIA